MNRSVWKSVFVDIDLVKKFDEILLFSFEKLNNVYNEKYNSNNNLQLSAIIEFAKYLTQQTPIEVWSRRSTILPEFLGFSFNIYNGKDYKKIIIKKNMIFHKFGEYSITKKLGSDIHIIKKKKKKESKKKRKS